MDHSEPQNGPDDRALLERSAAGDQKAFGQLVARHVGLVQTLARRMMRNEADADDIAQEALLRLWRSGDALVIGPNGVRPWLRRVVSNLCIDRIRANRKLVVVEEVPEEMHPVVESNPADEFDAGQRVDAALKSLPERQRQALTLFHYEGLSQAEIGALMQISDEAVESLLARARRSVKAALKDEWRSLIASDAG
jgi:RNA polymerase sigma-70 factor (ECF subfamily)